MLSDFSPNKEALSGVVSQYSNLIAHLVKKHLVVLQKKKTQNFFAMLLLQLLTSKDCKGQMEKDEQQDVSDHKRLNHEMCFF